MKQVPQEITEVFYKISLPVGILILIFLTASCELEEEVESATMCYELDGNYLTLNCYSDYLHTCESDGKSSLAGYDTWDACIDDMSNVLDYFSNTGEIKPGPNSNGGSGGDGGSSVDCDIANYDGPEFDIQVDSQCKAAYLYDCVGDTAARDAACHLYYEYGNAVWTGSGSLPDCRYCN